MVRCLVLFTLLQIWAPAFFAQNTHAIDSLTAELETADSDSARIFILNDLSFLHWYNDPELSKKYAERSAKLAKATGNYDGGYDANSSLANYYLMVGEYVKALRLYQTNIDDAVYYRDSLGLGIGYMNKGVALDYQNRPAEALENYFLSLNILSALSSDRMGTLFMNIGTVYMDQGKLDLAEDYYQQALQNALRIEDNELLAFIHVSLAENYLQKNSLEPAMQQIKLGLEKARASVTTSMEASAYTLMGIYYSKQSNYEEAIKCFKKAESIEEEISGVENRSLNFFHWGMVHYERGELEQAEELFTKQFDLARNSNDFVELSRSSEALAKIQSKRGNSRKAFELLSQAISFRDSLAEQNNTFDIGRLESQQLVDKIAMENDVLKGEQMLKSQELKEQDSEIRQQKLLIAFGIAILAMLVIVIILLQRAYRERTRAAISMETKNTEIATQQAQIIKQKENLEQLNKIKDQIFSMVSHDLRAPLLNIKSGLELWNSDLLSKKEARTVFTSLYSETAKNLNLLDNLLFWAKSQLEGFTLTPETIDLHPLVSNNIQLFETQIANKQLKINLELESPLKIHADRDMMDLVVRNFLHNAIKFTPQGGSVTFKAQKNNGKIKFCIIDTGVGMEPQAVEDILAPLSHISKLGTSNEKGTGLGLKICMDFVKQNKGKFVFKSQLNKGTEAGFIMPEGEDI